MPITVPDGLPSIDLLRQEHIFTINEYRATHQDIRPLRIVLLNLMPKKIETETQLLRMLSNTPLQMEVELLQVSSHKSKNTPQEHLLKFYKTFEEIRGERFDGMIITGAPVEQMPFEAVDYWQELCQRGELLGGTEKDYGVVKDPCSFHSPYLLGSTGGTLLPLPNPQIRPAPKDVRRV